MFMKRHRESSLVIISVFSLIFNSCAGLSIKPSYLSTPPNGLNTLTYAEGDRERLLDEIHSLRQKYVRRSGKLKIEDYDNLLHELRPVVDEYKSRVEGCGNIDFQEQTITVPANSSVTLELNTYCLSPHAAAPSDDEPYILVSETTGIPLYHEIMKFTNTKVRISQTMKQSLIWNLRNNVKFEDLPFDQQALLTRIDSAAYLKVNNKIKEQLKNGFSLLLSQYVPVDVLNTISVVKGKSYDYDVYRRNIENLKSRIRKTSNGCIKAEGYNIFAMVKPHGFSHATVTFVNTSNEDQTIHSFFKPLRKDVQPLGYDVPNLDEFRDSLKQAFGELAVDIAALLRFKLGAGDRLTIECNPEELIDLVKVFRDREIAFEQTERNFGDNFEDDKSDAFRHAFWNAIMVRDVGYEFAKQIADNHELNGGKADARNMDLWNNKIGRDIGQQLKDTGISSNAEINQEILNNMSRLRKLK